MIQVPGIPGNHAHAQTVCTRPNFSWYKAIPNRAEVLTASLLASAIDSSNLHMLK